MLSTLLAIGWKPELHGVVIIIIATVALPGTIYLLLGTNLGARLGAFVEKETNDLDTLGQACVQQRRAPVATMHTVNSIITVHT